MALNLLYIKQVAQNVLDVGNLMLPKKTAYVRDVRRLLMFDLSSEIDNIIVLWSVMGLIVGSLSVLIVVKVLGRNR